MRLSSATDLIVMIAVGLILAVMAFASSSCDTGDDITSTPTEPAKAKPTTAANQVEDRSPKKVGDGSAREVDEESGSLPLSDNDAKTALTDLRNAAVAQEAYFTENATYSTEMNDLVQLGYEPSGNIDMFVAEASNFHYCLEAFDVENSGLTWFFDSYAGEPQQGSCP